MLNSDKESLEQIIAEKELLFGCRTNKGFTQRLFTKFLLMLRNHNSIMVLNENLGKIEIEEDTLRKQAYKELSQAFVKVKKVLKDLEARGTTVFLTNDCKVTACQDILNAICSENSFLSCREPPYARVYYKIRALYVNHISKSHEIEFAPSALVLIEKDKMNNFLASSDCDPVFLWRYLISIEEAWKVAGNKLSVRWEKISEDDRKMWLNSDNAFRTAFRNYVANELWNSDDLSYRKEFYHRPHIESVIERLLKEIAVHVTSNSGFKVNQSDHGHTQKKNEDVKALIPFAKKIWEKEFPNSSNPMHMSRADLAINLLANLPNTVRLYAEGKARLPRAKAAIKETDPRRFKGGKYLGPKTHWQNFGWVKT